MIRIDRMTCCYCGTCVAVCPRMALELADAYLSADPGCISCAICADICPVGALEVTDEERI